MRIYFAFRKIDMPFTAAHPIAVVYLQRLPWKLSLIALVAGSIAPDMELYFRLRAHAVGNENLLVQLPLAFGLGLAWEFGLYGLAIHLLPHQLTTKFAISSPAGWARNAMRQPISCLLALLIGILSHWIWDSFTHHDGFLISFLPFLSHTIGIPGLLSEIPLFDWLQVLCSIAGVLFLLRFKYLQVAAAETGEIIIPKRLNRIRMRFFWLLLWLGIAAGSYRIIPASDFMWDEVFRVLGSGVYAAFVLALLLRLSERRLRIGESAQGAGIG